MNNTTTTFRLSMLAAAMLSAFGPAHAEDDELAALTKPDSFVSFSAGNWSNDRHQLGIYDGLRDQGAYGNVDFRLNNRDDATGTWTTVAGSNLGLDIREIRADYLRQGDFGLFLENGRTVRDNPLTFTTGLQGIGTAQQTISGVGAANTFPRRDVTLGTRRDLTQLGVYKSLTESLAFNATFKHEDKDGTRQWGRGGAPEFAVEPINSTTQQFDAILSYTAEKLQMSGGYSGSWYRNGYNLVDTRQAGGAASTRFFLSLPLNNEAHQVFVDGGYNFTPSTRGSFKLSYSRATQDEHLPTADIPGLASPLAPRNLDGQIDTTVAQVALVSNPLPKLSVLANLRYQDVDDKTPVVRTVFTGATVVHNTPHSISTTSGKVEATYQLPARFLLTGGMDMSEQDRSFPAFEAERFVPFRATLEEDTYRLQLRRPLTDTVSGSVAFLHSQRDGSDFLVTEAFASDLINPIHIADRERDKWRLTVNWAPTNSFTLQGNYEDARDDYGNSASRPYGLRDGTATRYSLDATYALGEDWNFAGWLSHDKTKANQFGARWDRVTEAYELDRAYHLKDTGDSVGFGFHGNLVSKVTVGADLQWTRNHSEYRDELSTAGPGLALTPAGAGGTTARQTVALPDIENKVARLALFAQYALQKTSDLRIDFIHERWETDDWSWMFSNGTAFTYGTTTDGTTVTAQPKQVSNFVGLRYTYRFQ